MAMFFAVLHYAVTQYVHTTNGRSFGGERWVAISSSEI